MHRQLVAVLAIFLPNFALSLALAADAGPEIVRPLRYRGVSIGTGLMGDQLKQVKAAYLAFPDDNFLKGFRERAGRSAPGKELGGWYSIDRFNPFGQVISGLARMYAGTGDIACKQKLDRLLAGWAACIEPDGYFFYSRKPNATHYGYEKMVCGLVDAYVFAGNAEGVKHLSRITDWAEKNLDRKNPYAFSGPGDPGEWYTLSENLYRAYLATGDDRYRDFAKVWEYDRFWEALRDGHDFYPDTDHHHAYSHINSLNGAAMAYRVTGEKRYLDIMVAGSELLQRRQCYASGGWGPGEHLLPLNELATALDDHPKENHFETQCCSWAAFKLAKSLISFTGDARYGDWIEALTINAIGSSLPVSDAGEVTYYSHYTLSGAAKNYSSGPWTCCSGTALQAVADYHDLIYFQDDRGLLVNLYTSSSCTVPVAGSTVTLRQQTGFPASDTTQIEVSVDRPSKFLVRLRCPAWLAGPMRVTVNEQPQEVKVDANGWVEIDREWRKGDEILTKFPMGLRSSSFPLDASAGYPKTICYGPMMLAFEAAHGNPCSKLDLVHPDRNLTQLPQLEGFPPTFRLHAEPPVDVRPFYDFKMDEPYFVYFDPSRPWSRVPVQSILFSKGWKALSGVSVTTEQNASVEVAFNGTAVRWVAKKFDDAGTAIVSIDGGEPKLVDLYDPVRNTFFQHDLEGLPKGKHTLRISNTNQRNAKSLGNFINVVRFESIGD